MDASGRPDEMVGHAIPDLTLPDHDGAPFSLRSHVGHGAQVLFFYIRNGTPG